MSDAMDDEFDTGPYWTVEAVSELGVEHAIPATCRGSASPGELAWLGEACELAAGARLIDVGAGTGGPAAWAAARYGVEPLLVEPMPGACRAASQLFGLPAVVAGGDAVPLPDASADAVWCLGVLCTMPEKAALVGELRRLLRPGGALGLLAFTADEPRPEGSPEGNTFPSRDDVRLLLERAGFEVVESIETTGFPPAPRSWTDRADSVEQHIDKHHGSDERRLTALDQSARMGHLLKTGAIIGVLYHARVRAV